MKTSESPSPRKLRCAFLVLFLCLIAPFKAFSFEPSSLYLGASLYQESILGRVTNSADGSPSTLGTGTYPLTLKYDIAVTSEWYFTPQIYYTPLGRKSAGSSTTTTILGINLPIGFNLVRWTETVLDWQFGFGLNQRSMKGAGGSDTLLNGSTPTVFIRPANSVTTNNVLFLLGSSLSYGSSRISFDLHFEGLLAEKRNYSAMLGYSYRIW